MELDSPIKAGEYEVSILSDDDENEKLINGNNQVEMMKPIAKVRKWETISGGAEVDILETAMPNFAHGKHFFKDLALELDLFEWHSTTALKVERLISLIY